MATDLFKLHMVTAGNSTCDLLVTLMLVVTGWDWKSATKLARLLTVMKAKKAKMRAHTSIRILDLALAALFRPGVQLNGKKCWHVVWIKNIFGSGLWGDLIRALQHDVGIVKFWTQFPQKCP